MKQGCRAGSMLPQIAGLLAVSSILLWPPVTAFAQATTAALRTPAPADQVNALSTASKLIDDTDTGWGWSGMESFEDSAFTGGTAHAGGPGSSGTYTFEGSNIDVYVMRGPDITVDDHTHKIGRLKVSIDGISNGDISLSRPTVTYNYCAFTQTGLAPGRHELRLEADAGWVVIDYIRVAGATQTDSPSAPSSDAGPEQPGAPGLLFAGKMTPLAGNDIIEAQNSVAGFNDNIGPELQPAILPDDWGLATIAAHSGKTAIRYSGSAVTGSSVPYCYMLAFRVNIPVHSNTQLEYWLFPQQDNGRYVSVDLHCTDGSILSRTAAVDQNGVGVSPTFGHGGGIGIYSWNLVRCNIGKWLGGKTVDKVWIGFARNGAVGQYRGYVDDLAIYNMPG